MKFQLRTAVAVGFLLAISSLLSAQAAQIGNVYVGTCDSVLWNTQLNEVDVYDATGQMVTTFHGPSQNACVSAMTFDAGDHAHVISSLLGSQSGNVLEFDNFGTILNSSGPFGGPTSVTHDLQGNIYLGQVSILKIDLTGHTTTFAVAGGAKWIDLAPDQRTMFYTTAGGDVKSFDIVSHTQGADIALKANARNVRVLGDGTILLNSLGAIQRWASPCDGCAFKKKMTYQVPANADTFSLDPDGVSFWTINTFYDNKNQLGQGNVYRTNIKTGEAMGAFALQPLTDGRSYAMSIGVNGDGMGSSAVATPSLSFAPHVVGTTSPSKKATLTNIGVVQVVVTNVTISGDFAIKKNNCTKPVQAGLSCNILVTFTPTQTGTRTGTLTIFNNAGNSPQKVTLSGVGK